MHELLEMVIARESNDLMNDEPMDFPSFPGGGGLKPPKSSAMTDLPEPPARPDPHDRPPINRVIPKRNALFPSKHWFETLHDALFPGLSLRRATVASRRAAGMPARLDAELSLVSSGELGQPRVRTC